MIEDVWDSKPQGQVVFFLLFLCVCKNIEYELLLVPLLEIISSTYHITKYYIVLNPLVVGHKLIKYYHKT